MEKPEQEELSDVLSAIRKMVRNETRAKFSDTAMTQSAPEMVEPKPVEQTAHQPNIPANVLILQPHMRVKKIRPKVLILDKSTRVFPDTPALSGESFAVANPLMDEGLLRDLVREVVQEQLRGELGKEIIGAIKRDMVQLLEKNR